MRDDVGRRVAVISGDQRAFLGYGVLEGFVTVFVIRNEDGSLSSLADATQRPEIEHGQSVEEITYNPKIVMDDGQVVYGVQVWWIDAEKFNKQFPEAAEEYAKRKAEAN